MKNKLINKIGKVLASIAVGAGSLISPVTSIAVSAASSEQAMQEKADTLVGNTEIDCWAGSALILDAADLLFFADDYDAKLLKTENNQGAYAVQGDQSKVILSDNSEYQLQAGDVLCFYSDATRYANGTPNHTMTYVGNTASSESSASKPYLNANINNTTMYTDNTYYGSTLYMAEVRRYHRTDSVNVPVTITETDPSNVLELTTPERNYIPVTNHQNQGKVSTDAADVRKAMPTGTYTNASFSGTSTGSSVEIRVVASSAYYDENSESRYVREITLGTTVYHGRESESSFDSNVLGQVLYLINSLPDEIKTKLENGEKLANENIRVRRIELIYKPVAGSDSSSDQQRKVSYYVDGSLDHSELLDVNTTVTFMPADTATKTFDGWYKSDAANAELFNGVVPAIAVGEQKVDGYYVLNLSGYMREPSGAKTTLDISAVDKTDAANPVPMQGVKMQVTNNRGTVIATGTTGNNGKLVLTSGTVSNLVPGIYTVTETELPNAPEGYTYGTVLLSQTSNTVQITVDTTVPMVFEHTATRVKTITFVTKDSDSDPDSDYTFPVSGYPTQTTTNGGYIAKPAPSPTRKGYTFDGWVTAGGTEFDFDRAVEDDGPLTLYAHWTPVPTKTITVKFFDDISNDADIKAAWNGNDLSSYNYNVTVTKGITADLVNSDHKALATILDELYAQNYGKKNIEEVFPSTAAYTTDETGADVEPTDVEIHLIHNTKVNSEDTTTTEVIRTIEFRKDSETGEKLEDDVIQKGAKQKTGTSTVTDLVNTDNPPIVTEGTKSIKYGWPTYSVPTIENYTPNIAIVPAVAEVEYDNFTDETVVVVYTENQTVTDVTVTITGNSATETYDGTEKSVTGFTYTSSNPDYTDADFTVSEQKTASRTEVGTTSLGLTKELFTNTNTNYNVTFVVLDGSLTVNPKPVTVIANDASKAVGDDDPTFSATVTGLIGDDTVNYSVYRAKGETVGTYKIFTAGAKSQGNYQITFVSGTFTIQAKDKPTPEPTETPDIPTPEPTEEGYTGWHTDIDDAQQTVTFPGIHTTASDITDSATDADKDQYFYIKDVVEYIGLTPETTYKLTGTLHYKNTDGTDGGEVMDGTDPVTETKTFKPHTSDGSTTMTFKVKRELLRNRTVVVFETCYQDTQEIAVHADITDEAQTVKITEPGIRTTAVETNTKAKKIVINSQAQTKTVYLTDTVEYTGLKPNRTYTLTGTIHKNVNGSDAGAMEDTGTTVTQTFTPSEPNGTVDMLFEFDGSVLDNGDKLVVFETLTLGGEEVGKHEDITDEDQTVEVEVRAGIISLRTTATGDSSTKNVEVSKMAVITDVVEYTGLVPSYEYTLKGELHKVTVDGTTKTDGGKIKEITMTFTSSETGDGTVTMIFSDVDVADLEGTDLVVFEYLYDAAAGSDAIAQHTNIEDEGQTVHVVGKVPTIGTTATGDNGGKTIKPTDKAKIVDTIAYNKVIADTEYVMKGELHLVNTDGTDGGKKAENSVTFTPSSESGTVKMEFTDIDASELEGRSFVVFEYLYKGDTKVAEHADVTDKGQTVDVRKESPTISTTATGENGDKTIKAGKEVKVVDTVTFKALTVGTEYTLTGSIHLIKDGKDEKTLSTETVKFKPTSENGTVKMEFTVDTSELHGRSLVVFEELKLETTVIATHADLSDKDQTVKVEDAPTPSGNPAIHTLAYNAADGYDTVYPIKNAGINDIVYYSGLTPGVSYTVEGTLHIKNPDGTDGGILFVDGMPAYGTKTFTPTVATGAVEITFAFDATNLNGVVVVAMEQLYLTDGYKFVTSHEDITDDDQTIWIERNPKRRRLRIRWIRTDAGKKVMIFGGIGLVATAALVALFIKRKKTASKKTTE